jgi:hypothetical protein
MCKYLIPRIPYLAPNRALLRVYSHSRYNNVFLLNENTSKVLFNGCRPVMNRATYYYSSTQKNAAAFADEILSTIKRNR